MAGFTAAELRQLTNVLDELDLLPEGVEVDEFNVRLTTTSDSDVVVGHVGKGRDNDGDRCYGFFPADSF